MHSLRQTERLRKRLAGALALCRVHDCQCLARGTMPLRIAAR